MEARGGEQCVLHQRRRRKKCSGGAHTLHRPAWPPLCISPDGVVSGHRAARRVRSPRGSCGAALSSKLLSACVRESEANYSFPSYSYWRVSVYILIVPAAIVIIETPTRGNAKTGLARRVCDFRSSTGDRRGEERGRGERERKKKEGFLFFSFLFFSFVCHEGARVSSQVAMEERRVEGQPRRAEGVTLPPALPALRGSLLSSSPAGC